MQPPEVPDVPEFAITIDPAEPSDDKAKAFREGKVLALRGNLDYFYAKLKRAERELEACHAEARMRERDFLLDLIQVADSFDAVFRMFEQDKKLRKRAAAAEQFRATYDTLLHALESKGVHKVPIEGKHYQEVEFRGVPIPEPWEVVHVTKAKKGGKPNKVVTQVLLALWVWQISDRKLLLLRRGKVAY